ncbi:hypothetical protein GCM10009416_07000 [Craurococcus roseus]|uniref:histidine kinase n=2 Tax=Craurococcus roseus TaxID=77585 RepID=A0ABN1EPA4_9PROT
MLALATGLLSFAAVVAAGLLASRAATERLHQGAAAELAQAARHVADTLDRGMFERWRDVQVAAAHPVLRNPAASPEAKREVLRLLQRTYPDYAITFLIGADGRIEVTSEGILEGVDVSRRDYFSGGRAGPYAGDVHEAVLMAKHLGPRPNGEPPRFVDLAAPVAGLDGRPAGVLAAHLFWDWAEGVERGVLEPMRVRRPGAEALVLARDGTVLLGPAALRGKGLADLASARAAGAGETGARLESWPAAAGGAAEAFVVGHAPTRGHRGYPGLGWTVLVRQDSAAAFAAAGALEREIFHWAGAVALFAAGIGWLLAHAATRPVRALTAIAERMAREPGAAADAERAAARLGRGCLCHEGAALGAAMACLIGSHRRAAAALAAEEARLREGEERLRAVVDATPDCVKLVGADGALLRMNPAGLRLLGAAPEEVVGRPVPDLVAPEHRALWAANHARVCAGESLVWEFDIVAPDGRRRSMETHAVPLRPPGGGPLAHLGVTRDVTERKAAAERQALLVRELDHRAKNALAVVQAALRLTPKDDPHAYARAVEGRVAALARAHTLLARARWAGADLRAVAQGELAPFLGAAADAPGAGPRAELDGPALDLKPGAAQALSMALHELATNATKHGALSVPGGRVSLSWRVNAASGELRLRWAERGGPPVEAPPARQGFGSRVLEATVRGQLRGRVSRAWEPAGLVCDVEVPLAQAVPPLAA